MKRAAAIMASLTVLVGCGDSSITASQRLRQAAGLPNYRDVFGASVNRDLATLRGVTVAFHDSATAAHAGWSTKITACMTDPAGGGGMGFHYGNLSLIDGTVRVDKPQLLLYEPEKNGRLRLVAVEYIIPYTFHGRAAAPPMLFGQEFQQNDAFQLWGLHAWVWEDNPSGMFANWNPRVNCHNTTDVMAMSH